MTSGSLGLRTGSYGSLQQHFQNGFRTYQTVPPVIVRKAPKMYKEKERMVSWFFKFAPRKKVGMLLLFAVSALVFGWVLYVGKGGDTQEGVHIPSMGLNDTLDYIHSGYFSPTADQKKFRIINSSIDRQTVSFSSGGRGIIAQAPPPPKYFTGYTLPAGNPCESFTLPPPPADKKRTGPRPCPVCYLPVEDAIARMPDAPSFSPVIQNISYIHENHLRRSEFGGSEFGGYPSLEQRNDSYNVRESMSVHCGFVRGTQPGHQTGFDIDDFDLREMEKCQGVVVASAIFGAYDLIQQPKNISETAKKNVCFFMFLDEETDKFLRKSTELDREKKLGLWRIVIIRNLPYNDPRRNGKIPKLLLHRLFPNARYSLWLDGKLELVVDPYQILERFLWRKNSTFAISRHYKRFDVFIEAEANKAAAKYDNDSIDFQTEFYRKEGLTPYSVAKLPITSDVPEGCVIIREHIPITNLFTCLWFNEVDRFTSRDQISFATVRNKITSKTNWTVNMFLDCERRNFVVQAYHRDVLEHLSPPQPRATSRPPPPLRATSRSPPPLRRTPNKASSGSSRGNVVPKNKIPPKRRTDRRSNSKRHRKVAAGSRDIS